MAYLEWQNDYSVGIAKIDEQHKKLFQYVSDLHDSMKTGKSKEVLSGIIDNLVSYTKSHFSLEEEYMSMHNYPGYLMHAKEHKDFIVKVNAFKNSYNLTSGIVSIEVMNFLKDWLINHVMGTDKKYVPYLMSKGVK